MDGRGRALDNVFVERLWRSVKCNRDLCAALFGDAKAPVQEWKRRSARTTRRLQLLRAHGLIRKIPRSHRWRLTPLGRNVSSAASLVGTASLKTLNNAAEFCSK